ncbi:MAG: RNA polymerase sigma-70 factor [Chlorobi bacterium]|nr:RNA polymerase sigma-70 factor [Chlorobiota bacterium]
MDFIIKEIQIGNKKAFKTFFNKNYEKLVIFANGYLYDQQASEDIVQDVFIYIWENARKLKIESSLDGYILVMVRNRCINFLKSINLTDVDNLLELNSIMLSEDFYEYDNNEETEKTHNQILKIIDSLPDKMREIAKKRFIQGYKYQEIAEEMSISVNTVKTQLKRAKKIIAELIAFITIILQQDSFS